MTEAIFPRRYELVFKIPGQLCQAISTWQQAIDLEVICHQIEKFGRALVAEFRGVQHVQQIRAVPALGEARPYYGQLGGAYRYLFRPRPAGCTLRVESIVSGRVLFHPARIPPLEMHLPDPAELRTMPNGSRDPLKPHAGYAFLDQRQSDGTGQLVFTITQDLYPRLLAWESYGQALTNYIYRFNPTEQGCLVHVTHIPSGHMLDLTKYT